MRKMGKGGRDNKEPEREWKCKIKEKRGGGLKMKIIRIERKEKRWEDSRREKKERKREEEGERRDRKVKKGTGK